MIKHNGGEKLSKKTFKGTTDTNVKVKKKEEKYLAIILKQNKSASLKWVSFSINEFSVDGNTYFTLPEGMYLGKKKLLLAMYLEGVSLPIGHKDIKWKKVEKKITNPETGEEEILEINEMDGLKFDSEIIDVLLGRGLA